MKPEIDEKLPADHFNLVCLKHWEDDIIWSSEEYRPKENSSALRNLAGWIPSSNGRTMQAYLSHLASKSKNNLICVCIVFIYLCILWYVRCLKKGFGIFEN